MEERRGAWFFFCPKYHAPQLLNAFPPSAYIEGRQMIAPEFEPQKGWCRECGGEPFEFDSKDIMFLLL
jgi:hypothetical protein